jgi:hypothetical protein
MILSFVLSSIAFLGCGDDARLKQIHDTVARDPGTAEAESLMAAFVRDPLRLRTHGDSVRAMTLYLGHAGERYLRGDTITAALTFAQAASMLHLVPPPSDLDQFRRYAETLSEAALYLEAERTFRSVYGRTLVEAPALLDTLTAAYRAHSRRLALAPDSVRSRVERQMRSAPPPPAGFSALNLVLFLLLSGRLVVWVHRHLRAVESAEGLPSPDRPSP